MAPVARELSDDFGVLEPLQTADSIEDQLHELRDFIVENADAPVTLIGSSWGAMLGLLFAARYPDQVRKLLLVGSGVFEESYATGIQEVRLGRLNHQDREEVEALTLKLQIADEEAEKAFARLATLLTKADAYDPLTLDTEIIECQYRVYQSVWKEVQELRLRGGFLEAAREIRCPVVAVHGEYDPHPPEGIEMPLSGCLNDFRFILLKNCGHLPWIERQARDAFYGLLRQECRA
jgi:pimeloyl-ACP methyl ester carboxylesterase